MVELRALLLLSGVALALRVLPYSRVERGLARWTYPRPVHGDPILQARVVRAMRRASRVVPNATCLCQVTALHALLRMYGIEGQIRFGVAFDDMRSLEAHAWLVDERGTLIFDPGDRTCFEPLLHGRGSSPLE